MEISANTLRPHRLRAALPLRIRGMSAEQRFFDEETESLVVSEHEVITRIHALPELDTEIHVTSLKNGVAGTFRVTWLGVEPQNGSIDLGLEKIETEGDLWEMQFPAADNSAEETLPQARLECLRCHQKLVCAIPEAEEEFVRPGFRISRPCEECRATTAWEYTPADELEESNGATPSAGSAADLRGKGRAPLRIQLKVVKKSFGAALEDVCHTENISRTGAYFYSSKHYEVGELVSVILPYKEGDLAIPVAARVVRLDEPASGYFHGVAIHLLSGENR